MEVTPTFHKDGRYEKLVLKFTEEAVRVALLSKEEGHPSIVPGSPKSVRTNAEKRVKSEGGDPTDAVAILSATTMQFGKYRS